MSTPDDAKRQPRPPGPVPGVTRRSPGAPPDGTESPFAVERVAGLVRDVGREIDDRAAWPGLTLAPAPTPALASPMRPTPIATEPTQHPPSHAAAILTAGAAALDPLAAHLGSMGVPLTGIGDLVHSAMQGTWPVLPGPDGAPRWVTLGEAARHAADVFGPAASERGIRMFVRVAPDAEGLSAGPLYAALLHAVRNAVESVGRACELVPGRVGGTVELRAFITGYGEGARLQIEVRDDGMGVSNEEAGAAMTLGFSTKPNHFGVGLALARAIVAQSGGAIELRPREDHPGFGRGALLRIACPLRGGYL